MAVLTGALDEMAAEDRPHFLEWVASRGLLGIAEAGGLRVAALVAYRFADTLAGAVQ